MILLLLFYMECKDYPLFIENVPLSKYLQKPFSYDIFVKNTNLK